MRQRQLPTNSSQHRVSDCISTRALQVYAYCVGCINFTHRTILSHSALDVHSKHFESCHFRQMACISYMTLRHSNAVLPLCSFGIRF